jgi:hypothetical protein
MVTLPGSVELASIVDEAAGRLRYALKAATDSGEDTASAGHESTHGNRQPAGRC